MGPTLSPKTSFSRVCMGSFPRSTLQTCTSGPREGQGAAVWGMWMETECHVSGERRGREQGTGEDGQLSLCCLFRTENPQKS